MSFDWSHYLYLSGDLLHRHSDVTTYDSACWRTIISRSYYAALHVAKAYCVRTDKRLWARVERAARHERQRGDGPLRSHSLIDDWFEKRDNAPENEAADILRTLREARTRADYEAGEDISMRDAEAAYGQAKEIIEEMAAIIG